MDSLHFQTIWSSEITWKLFLLGTTHICVNCEMGGNNPFMFQSLCVGLKKQEQPEDSMHLHWDDVCSLPDTCCGCLCSFLFVIEHMMPLCMVISWVYSVAMMIQHIVAEKEHRLKEVGACSGYRLTFSSSASLLLFLAFGPAVLVLTNFLWGLKAAFSGFYWIVFGCFWLLFNSRWANTVLLTFWLFFPPFGMFGVPQFETEVVSKNIELHWLF